MRPQTVPGARAAVTITNDNREYCCLKVIDIRKIEGRSLKSADNATGDSFGILNARS